MAYYIYCNLSKVFNFMNCLLCLGNTILPNTITSTGWDVNAYSKIVDWCVCTIADELKRLMWLLEINLLNHVENKHFGGLC